MRICIMYQDNQSAILLEKMAEALAESVHDILIFSTSLLQTQIRNGEMSVEYCPTVDMIAKFFTAIAGQSIPTNEGTYTKYI